MIQAQALQAATTSILTINMPVRLIFRQYTLLLVVGSPIRLTTRSNQFEVQSRTGGVSYGKTEVAVKIVDVGKIPEEINAAIATAMSAMGRMISLWHFR